MKEKNNEVFEKVENQVETIDETVESTITDMGTFYKDIVDKLTKDGVCHLTKKKLKEPFLVIKVPDNKVDKGMIAFVAVNKEENI